MSPSEEQTNNDSRYTQTQKKQHTKATSVHFLNEVTMLNQNSGFPTFNSFSLNI